MGKASPVHFFWGSFDLAVTRFSGRRAPTFTGKAPGLDATDHAGSLFTRSEQRGILAGRRWNRLRGFLFVCVSDAGAIQEPPVKHGTFNETLGEFILPYEQVRTAADPDAMLLEFLQSTYEAAAETAQLGSQRAGMCAGRA